MNNIFKKFLQFAVGSGIALVLGLFSSPIISRLLSTEESGVFTQFNTIASLLCLIILVGYDQAYARFFYEEDKDGRRGLLKECLRIPIMIWSLVSIISLIFYKPVSIFICGKANLGLVLLLVFHVLFCIVLSFALLVIRMKQRGKIFSVIQVLTKATYIVFFLIMYVALGDNYWSLVLGLFVSNLFVLIFSIWIEKSEWTSLNNTVQIKIDRKKIFNYAFPLVFAATISWLLSSVNNIFIRAYDSTFKELGVYGQAFSIISLLIAFQSAFSTFWVPTANENYINNPDNKDFFAKINSYVIVGMFTLAIVFVGCKDLIIYILGEKYRDAKFIMPFLIFMPVMSTISEVTGVGISFKKKTKYNIVIALIAAITNISGNFLLVPSLGGRGAAISVGVSYIVYYIVRTLFSANLYKVKYDIKRLLILIMSMLVFASYSTFHSFDIIIVVMTIANIILVVVLYNDVVKEIYLTVNNTIHKKRKNKLIK